MYHTCQLRYITLSHHQMSSVNTLWIWKTLNSLIWSWNPPRSAQIHLGEFEQTLVNFSQIQLVLQIVQAILYTIPSETSGGTGIYIFFIHIMVNGFILSLTYRRLFVCWFCSFFLHWLPLQMTNATDERFNGVWLRCKKYRSA